jgi:hypothetical protein
MICFAQEPVLEEAMKDLIKQYLDQGISRRQLMSGLTALGISTVAAKAMAQSLAPFAGPAQAATPQGSMREMTGRGGALFVQQLTAAGAQYIFFNPSTGDAPIFDALVNEPSIQLIKGVQEGAVAAMAGGYARLSALPTTASPSQRRSSLKTSSRTWAPRWCARSHQKPPTRPVTALRPQHRAFGLTPRMARPPRQTERKRSRRNSLVDRLIGSLCKLPRVRVCQPEQAAGVGRRTACVANGARNA